MLRRTLETAAKTGKGRSTIAREAKRGADIRDVAQLAGTSLDLGVELDAMARLPEAEQRALATAAKAGRKVSARQHSKKLKREIHGESEAGREGHRAARVRWPCPAAPADDGQGQAGAVRQHERGRRRNYCGSAASWRRSPDSSRNAPMPLARLSFSTLHRVGLFLISTLRIIVSSLRPVRRCGT